MIKLFSIPGFCFSEEGKGTIDVGTDSAVHTYQEQRFNQGIHPVVNRCRMGYVDRKLIVVFEVSLGIACLADDVHIAELRGIGIHIESYNHLIEDLRVSNHRR